MNSLQPVIYEFPAAASAAWNGAVLTAIYSVAGWVSEDSARIATSHCSSPNYLARR